MTDENAKVKRGYPPTIILYIAETGPDHIDSPQDVDNRLAFHTLEDAKDWVDGELGGWEYELVDLGHGTWRAEVDFGPWAEIRRSRLTQPRRLLRDDRGERE